MSITKDDVLKIAHLARLAIDADHAESYTHALNQILEYMEQLNRVNTSAVAPTFTATEHGATVHKDRVVPSPSHMREQVFREAPETDGQFFIVPQVIG